MLKPVAARNETGARPGKTYLVLIIGTLSAFGPLSIDMYLPGLPSLTRDLGGPAWQTQLTLTASLLGLAGGQVVAGPLSDKFGRRRPLLAGLLAYTLASLLCAVAPSVPFLILLRLAQGAAGAAGIVISRAVVRDLFSGQELARFFAMTMAVNGLAPILAPVIGGQLLNFTSWRGVFVVLGGIGLLLLAGTALGLGETLPDHRRRTGGLKETFITFGRLLSNRPFMGLALSSGLAYGALFAYISGSPFIMEDYFKVSAQLFSLMFAVNALGIILGSYTSGRLVRRISPRKLLLVGLCGSSSGGLILLVSAVGGLGLTGILPGFFLVVASIGFVNPNATALALADQHRTAGSASGLLGAFQFFVGGAVTPLVGLAGNATIFPLALTIAALASGALAVFFIMVDPALKRRIT